MARKFLIYDRPRSEASEGYVFTGVCHSVTDWGGGEGVDQGPGDNTSFPPSPLGPGDNTSLPPSGTR